MPLANGWSHHAGERHPGDGAGGAEGDVGVESGEAVGELRGDVAITAMLSDEGGATPKP